MEPSPNDTPEKSSRQQAIEKTAENEDSGNSKQKGADYLNLCQTIYENNKLQQKMLKNTKLISQKILRNSGMLRKVLENNKFLHKHGKTQQKDRKLLGNNCEDNSPQASNFNLDSSSSSQKPTKSPRGSQQTEAENSFVENNEMSAINNNISNSEDSNSSAKRKESNGDTTDEFSDLDFLDFFN